MVYYTLESVPEFIVEQAIDNLAGKLASDTNTVQNYATDAVSTATFNESNVEFETLVMTEVLQDVFDTLLTENRDELIDQGYSANEIEQMRLDIESELTRSVRIPVSDIVPEVLHYGYDQLPDRFDSGTIADNVEQIFANMQVGVTGSQIEINDFLVTSILRGAMYEKVDDIVYEVKHDERDDFNRSDGEDMRMRVGDAFKNMQTQ